MEIKNRLLFFLLGRALPDVAHPARSLSWIRLDLVTISVVYPWGRARGGGTGNHPCPLKRPCADRGDPRTAFPSLWGLWRGHCGGQLGYRGARPWPRISATLVARYHHLSWRGRKNRWLLVPQGPPGGLIHPLFWLPRGGHHGTFGALVGGSRGGPLGFLAVEPGPLVPIGTPWGHFWPKGKETLLVGGRIPGALFVGREFWAQFLGTLGAQGVWNFVGWPKKERFNLGVWEHRCLGFKNGLNSRGPRRSPLLGTPLAPGGGGKKFRTTWARGGADSPVGNRLYSPGETGNGGNKLWKPGYFFGGRGYIPPCC